MKRRFAGAITASRLPRRVDTDLSSAGRRAVEHSFGEVGAEPAVSSRITSGIGRNPLFLLDYDECGKNAAK
jgi:hypothetical protein